MTFCPKSGAPTEPVSHLIEEFQKLPGIGPEDLKIDELMARLKDGSVEEVYSICPGA